MFRRPNTKASGSEWSATEVIAVWVKGSIVENLEPYFWRADVCGKIIKIIDRGNHDSEFGWEIDHINPVVNGGGDEIGNLQPLHWENNLLKSDTLDWKCENK